MGKNNLRITPLEACDRASRLLRQVGFVFTESSMKSTSCYYTLPGYYGTLRVSEHSRKKDRNHFHQSGPVWSSITFPHGDTGLDGLLDTNEGRIEFVTASAIGLYLIRATLEQAEAVAA